MDIILTALARAGLFTLYVGQTAPTTNQASTAWLQPAQPSWSAEGALWLWDPVAEAYAPASPVLWAALLSPSGYRFQSVATLSGVIEPGVTVLAIERDAPAATSLLLPSVSAQWSTGRNLRIADWSTAVVDHTITLTTPDGATIGRNASWQLFSSAVQLANAELCPVPDVNGWIIK